MNGSVPVHTSIVRVPVASARRARVRWLERYCSDAEARRLEQRPVQSLAGDIALKRALAGLFSILADGRQFVERDFVVDRTREGAPRLAGFPSLRTPTKRDLRARLSVSITHTSTNAYGLAVYGEAPRG